MNAEENPIYQRLMSLYQQLDALTTERDALRTNLAQSEALLKNADEVFCRLGHISDETRIGWWLQDYDKYPKCQALSELLEPVEKALKAHHKHDQEDCYVYFMQDAKPIDQDTNLGESYQESALFEQTASALALLRQLKGEK